MDLDDLITATRLQLINVRGYSGDMAGMLVKLFANEINAHYLQEGENSNPRRLAKNINEVYKKQKEVRTE